MNAERGTLRAGRCLTHEGKTVPFTEQLKHASETLTGFMRPDWVDIETRPRKPNLYRFADDGETPNNPALPLIHYRGAVKLDSTYDPAAIFEVLFNQYGWVGAWRDGIYPFLHFHTRSHEVRGIARGNACVRFGGKRGRKIALKAGDVVIQPAGTGHCRIGASDDLLVVGAYPEGSAYDEPKPGEVDPQKARARIARVPVPPRDPVYGRKGPLTRIWGGNAR
jgi:uncharacterized protein YjlB